jgi:hypothetical protein
MKIKNTGPWLTGVDIDEVAGLVMNTMAMIKIQRQKDHKRYIDVIEKVIRKEKQKESSWSKFCRFFTRKEYIPPVVNVTREEVDEYLAKYYWPRQEIDNIEIRWENLYQMCKSIVDARDVAKDNKINITTHDLGVLKDWDLSFKELNQRIVE